MKPRKHSRFWKALRLINIIVGAAVSAVGILYNEAMLMFFGAFFCGFGIWIAPMLQQIWEWTDEQDSE